jgi:hypothetical protein
MVVNFKVEKLGFVGEVKIDMPKYPQRIRMFKDLNFSTSKDEDGKIVISTDGDNVMKNAEAFATMIEKSEPHIKEVSVKHIESETEYKSYDDLLSDSKCDILINDIVNFVFSGNTVGGS